MPIYMWQYSIIRWIQTQHITSILACKEKCDMPRRARRDIFADAKVILRCRAVILYSPSKLSEGQYHSRSEYHCRRQYHSPQGEYNWKSTCNCKCFFMAVMVLKDAAISFFSLPLKCPELRFPLPTESLPNWNVRMQKPFCKSASSSRTAQWLRQDEGQIFLIAIFKAW